MAVAMILGATIGLQIAAAAVAIEILLRTPRIVALWLVPVAALAIAAPRIHALGAYALNGTVPNVALTVEATMLAVSLLLVAAMVLLRPVFHGVAETEQALQETQDRYRLLVETMNDGLATADVNHIVTYANNRFCEILGRPLEEVVGHRALEFVQPEEQPRFAEHWAQGGPEQPGVHEAVLQRPDGRLVPVIASSSPLCNAAGEFIGAFGVITDITELRQVQHIKAQEERRFREMADLLPMMLFEVNPELRITYVNRAVLDALDYTQEDFDRGMHSPDVLTPMTLEQIPREIEEMLRTGKPVVSTYGVRRKDGTSIPCEVHTIAIRSAAGEFAGVRGVARNITDRLQAEQAWRDSERRFREMAELLPHMLFELDLNANLTYANRMFMEQIGDGTSDGAWLKSVSLLTRDSAKAFRQDLDRVRETGVTSVGEYQLVRVDGTQFPCEAHVAALRDADGTVVGFRGVARDVTERRQAEDSQRMVAVGELAAGVAHEFNNLLNIISAQAELARDQADEQARHALIDTILMATERGAEVAANLMGFARPTPPKRQVMAVEDAIEAALLMAAQELEDAGVSVVRDYRSQRQAVLADAGQLQQVFLNLILNAYQAMPGGGQLTVSTAPGLLESGRVEIVTTVSDTGHGIAAADLPRVFEPFFTTKDGGGDGQAVGTGLGLSVSLGIIKAHDGTIQARSEPGEGAVFEVRLATHDFGTAEPALGALSAARNLSAVADVSAAPAGAGRILLAEDGATLCAVFATMFRDHGFEVITAGTTDEALAAMDAEPFDAIVSDLMMPGGGGREVLAAAAQMPAAPPVVLITGRAEAAVQDELLALGAQRVLAKPVRLKSLLAAVEACLGRGE